MSYVEIAAVLVANTVVTLIGITTVSTRALGNAVLGARMRSVSGGDGVGLPDIHLRAASTVFARSGVLVIFRWLPALNVGLAIDPLDVVGTLGIAVTLTYR